MRNYPEDKDDQKDLDKLNAAPWMVECLKLNPAYCSWGPHEDYMWVKGDGWSSAKTFETWKEFGPWNLDELNEAVNFYFEINRDSKECETCAGNGYHPDAHWVSESFYHHTSPFVFPTDKERAIERGMHESFGSPLHTSIHGRGGYPSEETLKKYKPEFSTFCEEMRSGDGCWHDKIIQEEVDALVKQGRLSTFEGGKRTNPKRTAEEINAANHSGRSSFGMSHDGINRWILIEARLNRFGIPKSCSTCKGAGYLYTAPEARLGLVLWFLHPRKGASRGIDIKKIEKSEIKTVYKYLRDAAKRNAERFEKVIDQL